jgi:hypothetical protein
VTFTTRATVSGRCPRTEAVISRTYLPGLIAGRLSEILRAEIGLLAVIGSTQLAAEAGACVAIPNNRPILSVIDCLSARARTEYVTVSPRSSPYISQKIPSGSAVLTEVLGLALALAGARSPGNTSAD